MTLKSKNLILLLILASLWGPSFLFIKVAVAEISPLSLAALRTVIAAVVLVVFLYAKGGRLSRSLLFWKHVTIAGFFTHALPWVLISWGEIHIGSGLASILNGLTPLFTVLFAHWLLADDHMNRQKVAGTLVGFLGLLILIFPSLVVNLQATTFGILAIIIGAASYGFSMVYSKRHLKDAPALHAPAGQLLTSTIYMVPLSIVFDGFYRLGSLSSAAVGSLIALGVLGTALAFVLFYKILKTASASYISLVTYLMPIYGVALGMLFLDETLSWYSIAGAFLIITGIMISNKTIKFRPLVLKMSRLGL